MPAPGIWGPLLHVLEGLRPGLGQRAVQTGGVVIAALGQQLHGFGAVPGFDHPVHPLPGEELVLHGPDAGGDGQIIRIFFAVGQSRCPLPYD